jgi:hypothetical protein
MLMMVGKRKLHYILVLQFIFPHAHINYLLSYYSRKNEWAATLDKQVAELRARKRREGASMSDTEIRFNKEAMAEARKYLKVHPRPKPREVQIKTQPW